ncbi:MAG: DUF3791 domain-containing protein [Bacteroidaceae bacterium]|nr:DUF3791 domain-containing protein [Bacteroidaceae bacterium]
MDKKTLEFVTYCIGKLSILLKLPQQEIYKRLKTSGILYGYIVPSYDVLHTFSSRYLMEDLTEYMREKGVLPLDKATDIFYSSETASMIEDGVADLYCRSDKYLAEEIIREYQEAQQ